MDAMSYDKLIPKESAFEALRHLYRNQIAGVDWMLSVNGAEVLDHSPSFDTCSDHSWYGTWFVCASMNVLQPPLQSQPSTALQLSPSWTDGKSSSALGHCWALKGSNGFLEVKLARPVVPKKILVHSIPIEISPGHGKSAIKNFAIMGRIDGQYHMVLNATHNPSSLTSLESNEGFEVEVENQIMIQQVRVEVYSNHGNEYFTCFYHIALIGEDSSAEVA
ncbi:hypothetical protein GUITHDRAFT_162486 [Guillardia theta CCMP2712]|uniref:SUN domain-containing protein n=2 Tax=Guillardia theta TaxID=55529 RepID=L1JIR4_GUITC|nr:hypothetical protein GUITHDRAFT_162486 [Guillardia theta CCMP2712]EKX48408.1 hypothetical protein GUITHDRAFT_162486 [Guillardia theta CCMP2712]|eukprot:XP_005835388.1 hypothetical protein GUITHDRAFT_162486 [Guillardia theta CCMP2712]